jgi:chromosome condensin MukBEF complex kleisin-like MukF subunit
MNYSTSTERATDRIPAVIAWSATEVDAYSEPPFPEDAFCIQLAVLNGERHIYRLKRASLTQLFGRISQLLGKTVSSKDAS